MTDMLRMFKRVGLKRNLSETEDMVCMPEFIWGKQELSHTNKELRGRNPIFEKGREPG